MPLLEIEIYQQQVCDDFWLAGKNSNGEPIRKNVG